jgi:uncharacterized membrane protein
MTKTSFKIIKWTTLIIAIILFGYRVFLTNTSKELNKKYYDGSQIFYDSSKEGIIVSILCVVMFLVFAIFNALSTLEKK